MSATCDHDVGLITLVGRSNVGKSTLVNKILKRRVSAVSRRVNTTRRSTANVCDSGPRRMIYVDTPGVNSSRRSDNLLRDVLSNHEEGSGAVIFMVDRTRWNEREDLIVDQLSQLRCPVILMINKIDRMAEKWRLLPYMKSTGARMNFGEILPLCATRNDDVGRLVNIARKLATPTRWETIRRKINLNSEEFMIKEIIRERLMYSFGDEIPYVSEVDIVSREIGDTSEDLEVSILVEREGQRRMMIGNRAAKIRKISTSAKRSMEKNFARKINLNLRVKLKSKTRGSSHEIFPARRWRDRDVPGCDVNLSRSQGGGTTCRPDHLPKFADQLTQEEMIPSIRSDELTFTS